jgi:hypothetical protein
MPTHQPAGEREEVVQISAAQRDNSTALGDELGKTRVKEGTKAALKSLTNTTAAVDGHAQPTTSWP